jgi:GAF domain-containing protein
LNYGLLQLSDKLDGGDFDEDDEQHLKRLAELAAMALDALAKVRKLRGGEAVPFVPREGFASFVQIESV